MKKFLDFTNEYYWYILIMCAVTCVLSPYVEVSVPALALQGIVMGARWQRDYGE